MVQSDSPNNHVRHPCPCRSYETHRAYRRAHPKQHSKHVKKYYIKHREAILLQKAYKRYLSGGTKKLHKQTMIRLAKAGFDVPQMPLSNLTDTGVSLGLFTGIEVS
jgi:hypothetical protein